MFGPDVGHCLGVQSVLTWTLCLGNNGEAREYATSNSVSVPACLAAIISSRHTNSAGVRQPQNNKHGPSGAPALSRRMARQCCRKPRNGPMPVPAPTITRDARGFGGRVKSGTCIPSIPSTILNPGYLHKMPAFGRRLAKGWAV